MAEATSFDFSAFDDEFKPTDKIRPEDLADGDYDFECIASSTKMVKNKTPVIEMDLKVLNPGKFLNSVVEHSIWIREKKNAENFANFLKKMGFDVEKWHDEGRKPSTEIPKAVRLLRGLKIKGKKESNPGEQEIAGKKVPKTWHNLYLNSRIATDGKPAKFGPDELNAPDPDDPFA